MRIEKGTDMNHRGGLKKGSKKRAVLWVLLSLLFLLGGMTLIAQSKKPLHADSYEWRELSPEQTLSPPEDGFQTFFPGVDVCAMVRTEDDWVVGGSDGMYRFTPSTGIALEAVGLRYVYALLLRSETIYAGYDGGLLEEVAGEITRSSWEDRIPDKRVRCLFLDEEEKIWAGTFSGAFCEDGKSLTSASGLAADMVNAMMRTSDGSVWLGSYVAPAGGISVLHKEQIEIFEELAHQNITAMTELKKDFVLTGGGFFNKGGGNVFHKDGDSWKIVQTIRKEQGLPGEKIRSFFLDEKGYLWIGSEYDGLGMYEPEWHGVELVLKPMLYLTEKDGLADDEVKIIQEDAGYYYFGTLNGLTRVEKKQIYDRIESLNSE